MLTFVRGLAHSSGHAPPKTLVSLRLATILHVDHSIIIYLKPGGIITYE